MSPLPQPRKQPVQRRSRLMVETILAATARILADQGYGGTNTNAIAERAGVSIGSIYQYFPHKEALITALHERHAEEMGRVIDRVLSEHPADTLALGIKAMIAAALAAHQLDPALHRVLEREVPFFDAPHSDSPADGAIYRRVRAFLEQHRAAITQPDLDLATWTVLRIMEPLIHSIVIDRPPFPAAALTAAVESALLGYLCFTPDDQARSNSSTSASSA